MGKTKQANPTTTRKYKKDFLKQVIVRVDFARPIELSAKGPPQQFIRSLPSFPVSVLDVKCLRQVHLSPDAETRETTDRLEDWTYRSKSGHKKAVLNKACFFIEYSNYSTYESLRAEFLKALESLVHAIPDVVLGRLGLRYVDHIRIDEPKPTFWEKYLIPELLSSFKLADDLDTVSRSFHVMEFSYPDETKMRFQFGMPNPDFPAPIKQKLFVLDYDAYCQLVIQPEDIPALLDIFHERTNHAFEQVITEGLRRKMEVKK